VQSDGVRGFGANDAGVYGYGGPLGVYGGGTSYGVKGVSDSGTGVYAVSTSGYALYATTSGTTGIYGQAATNGVEGVATTGVYGYSSSQTGVYGQGAVYGVYSNGNFAASGTKSAVVALPDNRVVSLYAMESPSNWFEDFGTAQLHNGRVQVDLDPTYAQTVNTTASYHVFLTPKGDCRGLYVSLQTPGGFEVRELQGGQASIEFDYRVVALRKGYEDLRLQQMEADSETVQEIRQQPSRRPNMIPKPALSNPQ